MLVLGLTGSLAMGKSTVAAMFAAEGAAIFDADAAVRGLYAGAAVGPVGAAFPGAVKDGIVDRTALAGHVANDAAALARLEAIVHPLVHAAEDAFRASAAATGRRVVVLDIPLLLETGGEGRVDAVVVVSAPESIQRQRIAGRPGLTAERAEALLARQMPDAEKRRRAHFIVDTSDDLAATRREVADIMRAVAAAAAAASG